MRALWMFGLVALSSCSVVLELNECEVDAHCPDFGPSSGQVCRAGRCQVLDSVALGVEANITTNETWEAGSTVSLQSVVFVEPGTTLTIERGTTILGEPGSALIVQAGAQLNARGTEFEPIVFTSAAPEGQRVPGDWGGVALLGRAPVNTAGPVLEGISDSSRGGYGGSDATSSCGVMVYVRIEFAGFPINQDEELNGLTLAGCGSGTLINFVQVHMGLDDGIEFFGGTANLRHAVITRAQDDALDYDKGWTGAAQFVAVQQDEGGDNGIEASSSTDGAVPRTSPTIWNLTLIGSGAGGSQRGVTFKDDTAGNIENALLIGHPIEAIDIEGSDTAALLEAGDLSVRHSLFFNSGSDGEHYFPTLEDETERMPGDGRDNDGGFDEDSFFRAEESLTFGADPKLADPYNLVAPGWMPTGGAAAQAGTSPPRALFDGFDERADYAGAFQPNQEPWTANWTAYPES